MNPSFRAVDPFLLTMSGNGRRNWQELEDKIVKFFKLAAMK